MASILHYRIRVKVNKRNVKLKQKIPTMSNLLPQVLRRRGLDVSDDADPDVLVKLIMKQVRVSFVN